MGCFWMKYDLLSDTFEGRRIPENAKDQTPNGIVRDKNMMNPTNLVDIFVHLDMVVSIV